MQFTFEQTKEGIILGDSFDILKKIKEDYKDKDFDEKPEIARLFNKFSGNYFSPTFIKSFMTCPMRCFLNYFDPREASPVTNLGSATHKVYERIVVEKALEKAIQEKIAKEEYKNFHLTKDQLKTYEKYINNFIKFNNYNGGRLFEDGFNYFVEYFIREDNLTIFNCNLGSCYTLLDRFDINPDKKEINIVDYKTGKLVSTLDKILANYLDQLITYYWTARVNFPDFDINCWLYLTDNNSFHKLNVTDLEAQSKLVEKVYDFYNSITEQKSKGIFYSTHNEYCKYCNLRDKCLSNGGDCKNIIKEVEIT